MCGIFMVYIKLTAKNQRSSGFCLLKYMLWSPNGRNALQFVQFINHFSFGFLGYMKIYFFGNFGRMADSLLNNI